MKYIYIHVQRLHMYHGSLEKNSIKLNAPAF